MSLWVKCWLNPPRQKVSPAVATRDEEGRCVGTISTARKGRYFAWQSLLKLRFDSFAFPHGKRMMLMR